MHRSKTPAHSSIASSVPESSAEELPSAPQPASTHALPLACSSYADSFAHTPALLINGVLRPSALVLADERAQPQLARALDIVRDQGGFEAEALAARAWDARILLLGLDDVGHAAQRIRALESELTERAMAALPRRELLLRPAAVALDVPARDALALDLHLDCEEAVTDASVLTAAEIVADILRGALAVAAHVSVAVAVLPWFRVRCQLGEARVLSAALEGARMPKRGGAMQRALRGFGAAREELIEAQNQHVASAIAAMGLAFGNAPNRVRSALDVQLRRTAQSERLCRWHRKRSTLFGELELPLSLEAYGYRREPGEDREQARLRARHEAGTLAACVGMGSSLVALLEAVRAAAAEAAA
jgi:hypothetical protein